MSGLKQIIENQVDENITLQNIVERLQDENKILCKENAKNSQLQSNNDILKIQNEMLVDTNVKLLSKVEMLEKKLMLKNAKYVLV